MISATMDVLANMNLITVTQECVRPINLVVPRVFKQPSGSILKDSFRIGRLPLRSLRAHPVDFIQTYDGKR